jgi:hypothetical protein
MFIFRKQKNIANSVSRSEASTVCHDVSYYILLRDKKLFEGKESRDSLNKNGCRRNSEEEKAKHGKFSLTADFLPEI